MNFRATYEQILSDEGIRAAPYRDSLGFWTIGIGSRTMFGQEVTAATKPVTQRQAREQCFAELYQAGIDAQDYLPEFDLLNPVRQSVLVQVAYQLGLPGLSKFVHLRARLLAHDYDGAAAHMRASLAYRQTTARWERHARHMESGI